MTNVALIRPGATSYDEQERLQGTLDVPLCDCGVREVAELAERLAARGPLVALYCGPGACAQQTAEIIGKSLGLRPKTLQDLRNLDLGLWQGLQIEEVKKRGPRIYRRWVDDPRTIVPPNGESFDEALDRIRDALKPLIKRHSEETFGLVIPEPAARLVQSYLLQEPEVHLDEHPRTGDFEWIPVAPGICRNGRA